MRHAARSPAVWLWLLGAASLGIYALAFVRPYGLGRWAGVPQQTIAKIAPAPAPAAISYLLSFLALFLLYGAAARLARGPQRAAAWAAEL